MKRKLGFLLFGAALCAGLLSFTGCEESSGSDGVKKWTVTFDLNGGNIDGVTKSPTRTVNDGATLGNNMPSNPTISGYIFKCWNYDSGGQFTSSTLVTANITVEAEWMQEVKQITVTFDLAGGTLNGSTANRTRTVYDGSSLGSDMPSNPTRSGYTFDGWYTSSSGGTQFTADTTVTADRTVYARWIEGKNEQATVTFNLDGGNINGSTTAITRNVGFGASVGSANMPSNPTMSGYTFEGWYYYNEKDDVEEFTAYTPVTASTTVYANWIESKNEQVTVTFDPDGGTFGGHSTLLTRTVNSGASLGSVNMSQVGPTRDFYTFGGWHTEQNGGGTQITASTPITASITVYAYWRPIQYTVTFNLDGGNVSGSTGDITQSVDRGTSFGSTNMPANPTKSGFTFDGWYTAQNGAGSEFTNSTIVGADITVYAKWTEDVRPQVTVTFNLDGGNINGVTTAPTRTTTAGTSLGSNMPANPTKRGHIFGGWFQSQNGAGWPFNEATNVTENRTVYAKWTFDETTRWRVTFDLDGGNIGGVTTSPMLNVSHNSTVGANMPANPTRTGYDFGGWFASQNGAGGEFTADTPVTVDRTVYAKWTAVQYTVTFDLDGGNIAGDTTAQTLNVSHNSTVGVTNMPANPIQTGYTFGGWFPSQNGGGTQFTASTPITGDRTVYAKWTVVQYTVTFDLDGGNIAGDTTAQTFSVSYNSTVANMPANPTQTGHAFGGWYTAQNGAGGEFTASTQVTADTTVYAKWTAQWTVTFDLDGGNINGVTTTPTWTVNSGDSVGAENTPMPSRSGYAFGGWYTAQDGAGDLFTASTPVTADTTVYAKWSKSESIQIVLRPTSDDPQLSNASLFVDDSANFDAGSDYASWKWYWDGTAISGATSSTYTMAANSRTSGTYELSVVVTTNTGEKRSARCRVVIKAH